MSILPLTPGLLISMAVRYNHSFGMCDALLLSNPPKRDEKSLAAKQIKILRTVKLTYDQLKNAIDNNVTQRLAVKDQQLLEEMTGAGFYQPHKEENYKTWATNDALREATQLATDKVEKSPDFHLAIYDGDNDVPIFLYDPLQPMSAEDLALF